MPLWLIKQTQKFDIKKRALFLVESPSRPLAATRFEARTRNVEVRLRELPFEAAGVVMEEEAYRTHCKNSDELHGEIEGKICGGYPQKQKTCSPKKTGTRNKKNASVMPR